MGDESEEWTAASNGQALPDLSAGQPRRDCRLQTATEVLVMAQIQASSGRPFKGLGSLETATQGSGVRPPPCALFPSPAPRTQLATKSESPALDFEPLSGLRCGE